MDMKKSKGLVPVVMAAFLLVSACAGMARLNSAPEDLQKDVLKDTGIRNQAAKRPVGLDLFFTPPRIKYAAGARPSSILRSSPATEDGHQGRGTI